MTIIASAPSQWLLRHSLGCLFHWRILVLRVLPIHTASKERIVIITRLLQFIKRHTLAWSDIEQWRNQACLLLSSYTCLKTLNSWSVGRPVRPSIRPSVSQSVSAKFCEIKFHISLVERFRVDLETFYPFNCHTISYVSATSQGSRDLTMEAVFSFT